MEEPEPMFIDPSETMMPYDPCPPGIRMKKGDKVVKTDTLGNLSFGQILDSDTDGELCAVWEDGTQDSLNVLIHSDPPKFAVYDRPYAMGTRVSYLGKEGQVCGMNPIITGYLVGYEGLFAIPNLRDHLLYPIIDCAIGDTVIYNGWVGVVVNGTVDITYKYSSTKKHPVFFTTKEGLEKVRERQYYPRKSVGQLPHDILKKGTWSGGVNFINYLSYKNKFPTIHQIQLKSLEIEWYDKIGSTSNDPEDISKPPPVLSDKESITKLFGLKEHTSLEEKFSPNSVWTVRYDENLLEEYFNWKENFVEEYILKKEKLDASELVYKRPKHSLNISSLSRVAVKVMFFQTEVEVLFDDGSVLTTLSTNLMESTSPNVQACPYQDRRYLLGEVVKDRTDFLHPDKYGFIYSQNYTRRTVLVKWINVQRDGSVLVKEPEEMSQYDIVPYYKFYLLKNTPQIVIAKQKFEGMVKSICLVSGKVKVQCAEGPVKSFWAHELEFCTKKAFFSPQSGWEAREIPLPLDTKPAMLYCVQNANSVNLTGATSNGQLPRKFLNAGSPEDNYWTKVTSTSIPHEEDIMELRPGRLPDLSRDLDSCLLFAPTIYIEKFTFRKDIFTIVFVPPKDSIYQDIPFFLDCKITKHYPAPHALPRVILRLPRVEDPSWIHPSIASDGQISFPEELRDSDDLLGPVARVVKFLIDHVFGNYEPYVSLSVSLVKEGTSKIRIGNTTPISNSLILNNNNRLEGEVSSAILNASRAYNEACIIMLTQYIHGLLCNPPVAWKAWVENYFQENLSRICWRLTKYLEPFEADEPYNLITLNQKKGMSYLLYPVSHSFTLALKSRIDMLSTFIPPTKHCSTFSI